MAKTHIRPIFQRNDIEFDPQWQDFEISSFYFSFVSQFFHIDWSLYYGPKALTKNLMATPFIYEPKRGNYIPTC